MKNALFPEPLKDVLGVLRLLPNPSKAVRADPASTREPPVLPDRYLREGAAVAIPIARLTISSLPIEEKGAWGSRQLWILVV
jgi:hypothetical protein